jgi:hypothetical protein
MIDYDILIALYASQYLQGKREFPADLVHTSGAFSKVYNVEFKTYVNDMWQVTAGSLESWLASIKATNARRVSVQNIPTTSKEYQQLSDGQFSSDKRWGLVVEYPTHTEAWIRRQENRKLDRIRFLTWVYHRVDAELPELNVTVRQAKAALRSALNDIHPVSLQLSDHWYKWFKVALEQLDTPTPSHHRMNEAVELVSNLATRQLLSAAIQSDVFGGMGSWNDLPVLPELLDVYNKTSTALFEALNLSLQVAMNYATRAE